MPSCGRLCRSSLQRSIHYRVCRETKSPCCVGTYSGCRHRRLCSWRRFTWILSTGTPRCDLHLSNHLLPEDDRERGTVLVRLLDHYSAHGWLPEDRALPDYLPVVLDFAATLEPDEARVFLGSAAEGIGILRDNLRESQSPYAVLLEPVLHRAHFLSSMPVGAPL